MTARHGVLTLHGYGLTIKIERGHLHLEDGIADERRTGRFHKTDRTLKRLVILGHTGSITLDAIRWLHDAGVILTHLDVDGTLLATSAATGRNDARLRRAQAHATVNGLGLELARALVRRKIEGQAANAEQLPSGEAASQEIRQHLEELDVVTSVDELRGVEACAANAYWSAWSSLPVRFVKRDELRVPEHWSTFGQRVSVLTASPRRAINPANAVLNYLYATLEAETTLALKAVGLDPGMGVMHADQRNRESLALDVMEAVRPDVEAYVLELLTNRHFRKCDFFETSGGGCRILPSVATDLAATAPRWATLGSPIAEELAQTHFASDARQPTRLATSLTQANRSAARALVKKSGGRASKPKAPNLTSSFESCGRELAFRDRKLCDACLAEAKSERMRKLKKQTTAAGRDRSHTPAANTRRRETQLDHTTKQARWRATPPEERISEATYHDEIQPALASVTDKAIREATGLSLGYCADIRKGKRTPHPCHWADLVAVVSLRNSASVSNRGG